MLKKLKNIKRLNKKIFIIFAAFLLAFLVSGLLLQKGKKIKSVPAKKPLTFTRQFVGDYKYKGEIKGVMTASFGNNNNEGTVEVERNGSKLGFSIPLTDSSLNSDKNYFNPESVSFTSSDKIIEAKYNLVPNGLKEEIILNKIPAENKLPIKLKTENLIMKITTDGIPVFYGSSSKCNNETIEQCNNDSYQFHFERPFMKDGAGNVSYGVKYVFQNEKENQFQTKVGGNIKRTLLGSSTSEVEEQSGKTSEVMMMIEIDSAWLHDPKRVLPIIIDPTVVHDTSAEFAAGQLNRVKDTGSGSSPVLETYYQELPTDQYTVGLWHMNEASGNALDSSGNGNTGTPTGTSIVTGLMGNARSFNGTSDYIKKTSMGSQPTGNSPITLSAWFYSNSLSGARVISSVGVDGASPTAYGIYTNGSNAVASFASSNGIATGTITLQTSQWYFIVGVYDGSTNKVYVNGVLDKSVSYSSANLSAGDWNVGSWVNQASLFSGSIDEVRVSNIARTPEQIKADASRRPYSVYTSDVIDLSRNVVSWNSLSWTELGVATGDGETLKDATGLIAQWNFNATTSTATATNDAGSCGASCNGTLTSFTNTTGQDVLAGSGWTANNKRWGAGALMFDGVDDYVQVNSGYSPTTAASMSLWVTNRAWSTTSNEELIDSYDSTDPTNKRDRFSIRLWTAYNKKLTGMMTDASNNFYYVESSLSNPIPGKWYHVTLVRNGTSFSIYIDGKLSGSTTVSSNNFNTFDRIRIGNDALNGNKWNGAIDSVALYSRALGVAEIMSNYQAGNIEFQTRVGADTSPDDGSWEAWKPTTGETVISTLDSDVDNWDPAGTVTNPGTSCFNILYLGHSTGDGIYWIKPPGSVSAFQAYCDMTTDGGGWTLVYNNEFSGNEGGPTPSSTTTTTGTVGINNEHSINPQLINSQIGATQMLLVEDGSWLRFNNMTPTIFNNLWNMGTDAWYSVTSMNGTTYSVYNGYHGHASGVNQFSQSGAANTNTIFEYNYMMSGQDTNHYWHIWPNANGTYAIAAGVGGLRWGRILVRETVASNTITKSNESTIKTEGAGSMKIQVGAPKVDSYTSALWHLDETGGTGAYIKDYKIISGSSPTLGDSGSNPGSSCTHILVKRGSATDGIYWIKPPGSVSAFQAYCDMTTDGGGWTLVYNNQFSGNEGGPTPASTTTTTGTVGINNEHSINPQLINSQIGATQMLLVEDSSWIKFNNMTPTIFDNLWNMGTDAWYSVTSMNGTTYSVYNGYHGHASGVNQWNQSGAANTNTIFEYNYITGARDTNHYWHIWPNANGTYAIADGVGGLRWGRILVRDARVFPNNGTPTGTTVVNGISGKARSFNGSSDVISGSSTGLPTGNAARSIEAWVKSNTISGDHTIAGWGASGTSQANYINLYNNTFRFIGWSNDLTGPANVVSGQWYHVAATHDGTTTRLYVNGTEVVSGTKTLSTTSTNITIGTYQGYAAYFNGTIDEVRISNIARSAEEIAEAYRAGRDLYINKTISSTDLSGKSSLPFYVAADRPGSYLSAIIGESAFANYQPDGNTVGLWHLDEADSPDLNDSYPGFGGWSTATTSTCGSYSMMGGVNVFGTGAYTQKTIKNLSAGTYTVKFNYYKLESWDGESARFFWNGVQQWSRVGTYASGTNWCGNAAWFEEDWATTVIVNHPGGDATLKFDSTLDQTPDDESWGVNNIRVIGPIIKDSSGNGKNGTPTGTTFTQGKIGKGRSFNGSSDYITANNPMTGNSSRTISAWVKISSVSADPAGIVGWGTGGTGQISYLTASIAGSYNFGFWGYSADLNSGVPSRDNTWHFLTFTYNGTTGTLYVDGVSRASANLSLNSQNSPLYIGKDNVTGFLTYPYGLIDEVRIDNIARTADEIRQAYEVGLRTHPITIDFGAKLDSGNLITGSGDLGFTVDATYYGLQNKGDKLFKGDKIIIRENYDGTEYIAQGTVTSVTPSTGAVTVVSWDSGSTFPSGGYTVNASVFKWQREYWNVTEPLDSQLNAVTNLTLRVTDGNEGRTIWLDDLKSAGDYLTTPAGSTITSSIGNRYFQYRTIKHSSDEAVSASLTSVTLDYIVNTAPATPTLDAPTNTAANQLLSPLLKTTATDADSDYIRYKIELCENVGMTTNCQTFTQPTGSPQTGWTGQNAETNTAYTSGTQATYTLQTPLAAATTYYWRSYAIDPGGINTWSGTQTPYSFTTTTAPTAPTIPYAEGSSNPTGIIDLTPEFSAIHNDADGDAANYYEIEVNTNIGFTGTVMWDTGAVSMSSLANGVRSTDVSYAGTTLTFNGTTYYWRIRFTDVKGATGAWSTTQNFTMNNIPALPSLDLPTNGATNQSLLPVLKTTTTDADSDYLRYKIILCTDSAMTLNCQTFTQPTGSPQTGWTGQNTEINTAYTSGTQGIYTIQSVLNTSTDYYWKSYAIDPGGSNTWSSTQTTPYSFTTTLAPAVASNCRIQESSNDTFLNVIWTDNATNEDKYEVQRLVDGSGWSVLQTNLPANTLSYQDSTISQNHTYQYRVAPYLTVGPTYANWCYTSTLNIGIGNFGINGLRMNGLKFN